MAAGQSNFRLEENAQQWLDLAKRRLAFYQELYRSGRWTLYYPTQERFASRLLDVVRAAEIFQKVAAQHKITKPASYQNESRTAA